MSPWPMIVVRLREALHRAEQDWFFTAGAGLALQGMDRVPSDVDLLVDGTAAPAEAAEAELRARLTGLFPGGLSSRERPASALCHRSLHGTIDGTEVEIMLWPPARASELPPPWERVRWLATPHGVLPVVDPTWEERAYAVTDRPEKAAAVARFIAQRVPLRMR